MAQLAEPNRPLGAGWKDEICLSLKTHMNHGGVLLNEAYRLSYEHALYEAFDWCLNFNAARNLTATTRFSVWPQAKLFWANPSGKLEDLDMDSGEQMINYLFVVNGPVLTYLIGDDADLSEYVPTDEMKNLNIKKQPHAGTSAAGGIEPVNVPSTSNGRITRAYALYSLCLLIPIYLFV